MVRGCVYPAYSHAILGLAVWLLVLAIDALIVKSLQLVLLQFDRFKCSIASTVFTFCNAREVTPDWWRVLK